MQSNLGGEMSLGQECGTVLGSSDIYLKVFRVVKRTNTGVYCVIKCLLRI